VILICESKSQTQHDAKVLELDTTATTQDQEQRQDTGLVESGKFMLIRELFESATPDTYVYHASYLPNQASGLKSILTKGLQPSKEGYAGPGVYFAHDPEAFIMLIRKMLLCLELNGAI
jgi:hypothetical protein